MKRSRRFPFRLRVRWLWRMAYRESRGHRHHLLLFIAAISVGVAVIVALQSFSDNVTEAINNQARTLLGADLIISSRSPFPHTLKPLMATLPGERSREVRFSSMAYFPKNQRSRLAQVRALEGGFPFYGKVETIPENAIVEIRRGFPGALVEDSLLLQFGIKVGDAIKIGEVIFPIVGRLKKLPGETLVLSQIAPRVIIPLDYLEETQLIQFGSRSFYRNSYKYIQDYDYQQHIDHLKVLADGLDIDIHTVESRKESLGKTLGNLFHFLNLVGLAALLLGGIGIGSSMHVYISRKLNTVATLRCLGCKGSQTLFLYAIQALIIGLIGGIVGVLLGVGIQNLLPVVLQDILPINIPISLSGGAIGLGILTGTVTTLIFSMFPLISVRNVSPAQAVRIHYESHDKRGRLRYLIVPVVMGLIIVYSVATAQHWRYGLAFAVGIIVSVLGMALLAKALTVVLKYSIPARLPYVFRQGLSNLYRPQNQTLILVLCLGIATFLIMSLSLSKYQLLHQIKRSDANDKPNMVLFDIQPDQREQVKAVISKLGFPLLQEVPLVSMRLSSINGISIDEIRQNNRTQSGDKQIPQWALNREYRSTYRDHLVDSEKLVAGKFVGHRSQESQSIPISIEKGIAADLQVQLGDTIVFDVQGLPLRTTISSIRAVDWYRVQPNFFVVFPTGVLEEAPQTFVVASRVQDDSQSALLQRETTRHFPNVSSMDLTMVLDTMNSILNNISFAIEFMATFSLITGFIVLTCSMQINYLQRLKENVLLKILGASRRQVLGIMITEYFTLGFLAVNAGILLAVCGSLALSVFVFKIDFSIDWFSIGIANLIIIGLTIGIGMVNSVSLYKRQPLEVLRQQVM